MTDYTQSDWAELDANNTGVSPNGVQGGYPPSAVAPILRAMRGAAKRNHVRSNAIYTTTGTGNAYVLTYEGAPTAYVKGEIYRFFVDRANTGAATLNINALGAKAIVMPDGSALTASQIKSGRILEVAYNGTSFVLISSQEHDAKFTGTTSTVALTANTVTTASLTVNGPVSANTLSTGSLTVNNSISTNTLSTATLTTGLATATGTVPHYQLEETDTNTVGRVILSGGQLYLQAGAANSGANTSSGVIRFAGYNNTDVATFTVRTGGNWQEIYHQGNDGAGSGLDADLLDGQEGSYYLNATNFNAGTLNNARLPASMTGKTFTSNTTFDEATVFVDHAALADIRLSLAGILSSRLYRDTTGTVLRHYNATTGAAEGYLRIDGNAATSLVYNGSTIWHAGNDGSGSGLDADLLDGQDSAYYRNASNLNAGTIPSARISGAYSGITTLSTSGLLTITNAGEGIRLAGPAAADDPYLTFYAGGVRTGYIQHTDGTGVGNGFRLFNDVTDDYLYLSNVNTTSALKFYDSSTAADNTVWHSGNDGSGSGLDADTLDGYDVSRVFRDNTSFTSTGNLTLSNAAPYLRLQDTTTSAYDGRIRLDANNLYIDGSADGATYGEVLRFELDTKVGYMSQLFLTTSGEAIRLAAPTAGQDPYISWYSGATRTGFIQYLDTGTQTGFNIVNDVSDDRIVIDNTGSTSALRFWDNSRSALDVVLTSANIDNYDLAKYTTSSSNTLLDYPLGTVILARGTIDRQASADIWLDPNTTRFTTVAATSQLIGTWRARGQYTENSNNMNLFQRVA